MNCIIKLYEYREIIQFIYSIIVFYSKIPPLTPIGWSREYGIPVRDGVGAGAAGKFFRRRRRRRRRRLPGTPSPKFDYFTIWVEYNNTIHFSWKYNT